MSRKRKFRIGDVVKATKIASQRESGEPIRAVTTAGELADRSSLIGRLGVIEDVRMVRNEKLKVTAYVVAFFKSGSGVLDKSFDGYAPFLGDELELVSKVGEKAIVIGGI